VLDTPTISQRISQEEVVSNQSEIGYRSTPASLVDTGLAEKEVHVSNDVFP
jgi:hypothetical protein